MTQWEDMFSIESPTFKIVHKKSNISSLPFSMEIENNRFQLPSLLNLINNNNQIDDSTLITLKVKCFILIKFDFFSKVLYE